ncbi:MAG: DUF3106 domain-containing protein [Burkholderiales bacterium]|nr:DUF3106 domain-containing protein [Burkholderiales bacterium]
MMAQAQVPPPAASPRARPSAPAKTTMAPAPKEESKPTWAELSAQQQLALRPLGASWKTLSEQHKRKWIALSGNYQRMPPNEQQLLHSRMSEWAALSPQQRTQARLNFADTKKVPPQDKKAMWEAYQALPAEEKRKLAAGAQAVKPSPPPTAAAVKPVPPQKLTKVPAPKNNRTPGIAVAPNQVDHNTLLPQPGAVPPRQN